MENSQRYSIGPRPPFGAPKPGDLLIASPSVSDPLWRRAVVVVLTHDDDGSIAVMLNRRAGVVSDDLPGWVGDADDILAGGPVSTEALIGLSGMVESVPGDEIAPGIKMMDLDELDANYEESEAGSFPTRWRLFAGYAGWGPGQIGEEQQRGDWVVVPGTLTDVLDSQPESIWRTVLSRQDLPLKLWATQPDVPEFN